MKSKQILLLSLFLSICAIIYANVSPDDFTTEKLESEVTNCECGDHENGITRFDVEGTDCCEGKVSGNGTEITYTHQGGGVYAVDEITSVSGSDAQSDCCEK